MHANRHQKSKRDDLTRTASERYRKKTKILSLNALDQVSWRILSRLVNAMLCLEMLECSISKHYKWIRTLRISVPSPLMFLREILQVLSLWRALGIQAWNPKRLDDGWSCWGIVRVRGMSSHFSSPLALQLLLISCVVPIKWKFSPSKVTKPCLIFVISKPPIFIIEREGAAES